jgi:uncharacterized cupin superfamily protein
MKITRTKDMEWTPSLQKGKFGQRRKELGSMAIMSAGLWELAPGKKSFPFHMHTVTEEAMFVVSGKGQVRTPEGLTPIGAGDFIAFPPNEGAHQLINDGTEPLVYVGLGANAVGVDIVDYPDSGKIAARTGPPPKGQRFVYKKDQQMDYFAGEKDAE